MTVEEGADQVRSTLAQHRAATAERSGRVDDRGGGDVTTGLAGSWFKRGLQRPSPRRP